MGYWEPVLGEIYVLLGEIYRGHMSQYKSDSLILFSACLSFAGLFCYAVFVLNTEYGVSCILFQQWEN